MLVIGLVGSPIVGVIARAGSGAGVGVAGRGGCGMRAVTYRTPAPTVLPGTWFGQCLSCCGTPARYIAGRPAMRAPVLAGPAVHHLATAAALPEKADGCH